VEMAKKQKVIYVGGGG